MFTMCLLAVVVEGARLDAHPKYGLFGWFNSRLAFWTIFMNGFIATLLGTFGPILCLQFFSSIQCMNVFLLEPLIAQVLGFIFGIDSFPSVFTIAGCATVGYALFLINNKGSNSSAEQERILPPGFGAGADFEHEGDESKLLQHIEALEQRVDQLRIHATQLAKESGEPYDSKQMETNDG